MASGQQIANMGAAVSRESTKPEHSTPDGSNFKLHQKCIDQILNGNNQEYSIIYY